MPQNPAAMLQAFSQLMGDPAARQAMMQAAQQMGIPPQMIQMGMQLAGGGGGGAPPGAAMMQGPGGGGAPMPPDMGGAGPSGEGEMPPEAEGGGPPPDAEQMAQDQIDNAGATFDGVDAPTQNDIERLTEDPSPEMIKAFDAQFGEGAAEKYLGGEGGEPSEEPEGGGPEPQQANESDEY